MELFDGGSERGYREGMQQASALSHAGEMAEARALYERLVVEATELYGAYGELTLLTRGCLANTYRDDAPERACLLLEQVVRDAERVLGPVDDGRLAPRLDLAAMYGQAGDHGKCHELSRALLADCDRLLGSEHPRTAQARNLLRQSAGGLAQAELAALLDIPRDSFAEEPAPAGWKERLLAAASLIETARSYRARMLWDTRLSGAASDEDLHFEYDFEFVRPDRFHVVRGAWKQGGWAGLEPGWGEFDEWIVLGAEHYRQPMWWLVDDDETKAEHEREDRKLLADSYLELLRGTAPIAVHIRRGEQAAYLVAEYPTVAQAWSDLHEGSSSLLDARTSLWIELATGLVRRAEGGFVVPPPPGDGGGLTESFRHGFASYGDDIRIEAPELEVEAVGDQ
jgi:hypothetical protein